MLDFWRKWYLLNCLRRLEIKQSIENEDGVIGDHSSFVYLNNFLLAMSEKSLFIFKRSKGAQLKKMAQDSSLIDACVQGLPKLVEKIPEHVVYQRLGMDPNDIEHGDEFRNWIHLTGLGSEFTAFSNALAEFAEKYKVIWAIIAALIGYSPLVRPYLEALTAPISPWW